MVWLRNARVRYRCDVGLLYCSPQRTIILKSNRICFGRSHDHQSISVSAANDDLPRGCSVAANSFRMLFLKR
jgi:hypothetical protein